MAEVKIPTPRDELPAFAEMAALAISVVVAGMLAASIRRRVNARPSPLPCHRSSTAAACSARSVSPSRSKLTTAIISPGR